MIEKMNAKSYKGILKTFNELPIEVQNYFSHTTSLINDDYPFEVVIAYLYLKIEQAQNRILYGGVVKLHKAHKEVASRVVNEQHLTRAGFKVLYENIFGKALSAKIEKQLEYAEKIRDKTIHGKNVTDKALREAIIDCFNYAVLMNKEIYEIAEFKPFGNMKGFKGRGGSLEKDTTQWLLKGLGLAVRIKTYKDTKSRSNTKNIENL